MSERPHDILAAEAFVVPAPDPELHPHGPLKLPDDPTGIVEPHDVLAAEEFAMPAPRPGGRLSSDRRRAGQHKGRLALLAGGLLVAAIAMAVGRRFLRPA